MMFTGWPTCVWSVNRSIRASEEIAYIKRAALRFLTEIHRRALRALGNSPVGGVGEQQMTAERKARADEAQSFLLSAAAKFKAEGIIRAYWMPTAGVD